MEIEAQIGRTYEKRLEKAFEVEKLNRRKSYLFILALSLPLLLFLFPTLSSLTISSISHVPCPRPRLYRRRPRRPRPPPPLVRRLRPAAAESSASPRARGAPGLPTPVLNLVVSLIYRYCHSARYFFLSASRKLSLGLAAAVPRGH